MVEHVPRIILATLTTPALASHHLQEQTAVSRLIAMAQCTFLLWKL